MKNFDDILKTENNGPQKPPFDVPPGYFETFEDRLEAKIAALDEKPSNRKTIIRILKPVAGLAASFLLIMLLLKYPLQKITQDTNSQNETALVEDSDSWQDVLMGNTAFFDDNTLMSAITAEEGANTIQSDEVMTILSSEVTDYEVYAELYN